jgi:hypothetical protein
MEIDYNFDTKRGRYLSSIERDIKSQYLPSHNNYIEQISHTLIQIHDNSEKFVGCGNLINIKYNQKSFDILITAAHNIDIVLSVNDKIKIPINYDNYNKYSSESICASLLLNKNNLYKNDRLDYAIICGFSNLRQENYQFININNNYDEPKLNQKVLIFGLLANRIDKAIWTKKTTGNENIPVYAFQLPTHVTNVKESHFNIFYPNTMYFKHNSDNSIINEGKAPPDISGLSGSLVWIYNSESSVPKIAGIISSGAEQDNNGIKCIRTDKILDDLFAILNCV